MVLYSLVLKALKTLNTFLLSSGQNFYKKESISQVAAQGYQNDTVHNISMNVIKI